MTLNIFSIWLCAALFYAYQYILRVIPNVLKDSIYTTFHFSDATFGQFAGFWYLGYAISHIPVGIALDRYGTKTIFPLSAILCVLGILPLLVCEHWMMPILGRFLLGIGSSGATLSMFKIIRIYFTNEQFTRVLSLTCIIGVIGAIFGSYPLYFLLKLYSWQYIISAICGTGILLAVVLYKLLEHEYKQEQEPIYSTLKNLLKDKRLWGISLGAGFLAGPLEGFADAWSMESLVAIYGLSKDIASQATSVIFFGFLLGLMSISWLIDRVGATGAVILSGIIMLIAFLALILGVVPHALINLCLILIGMFSAYQVAAIYSAINLFDHKYTGLVTAIFNMIMMIFGSFFHTVIGSCVYYWGQKKPVLDNVCKYAPEVYQYGLTIIPIMLIAGILLFAIMIRPVQKVKHYEDH
jgi:MFS family permease